MKKLLFIIPFLFVGVFVNAQILDPVIWEFSQSKISESEVELQFKASIEEHWHLYSQFTGQFYGDEGPVPTSFVFKESENFKKTGKTVEEIPIEVFDPIFEMDLKYFEGEVTFSQKIKILNSNPFTIEGEINFMSCDEVQCIFPMPVPFSFNINSNGSIQEAEEQEIVTNQDIENTEKYNDKLVDLEDPISEQEASLWRIFLLGLLGGIIALITPCVFPMIPLTVSFFTKGEKGKGMFNAIMYGFFIMLIYFLLSIPFHFFPLNPEIFNQISTNTWLNLLFFVIFIVFALSFFGYFELALPSKWGNKADSGSNIGGLIGIFFMALTLAIVSFSCTGPILGSLLAGTLGGDVSTVVILGMEFKMVATKLTAGMTGFGLALGFPFALFALFPKNVRCITTIGRMAKFSKSSIRIFGSCTSHKIPFQCRYGRAMGLDKKRNLFCIMVYCWCANGIVFSWKNSISSRFFSKKDIKNSFRIYCDICIIYNISNTRNFWVLYKLVGT